MLQISICSPALLGYHYPFFEVLSDIPDELCIAGVKRLAREWTKTKGFPLPADIGEACVPGERYRRKYDPMTTKMELQDIPWAERLEAERRKLEPPKRPALRAMTDAERDYLYQNKL